MIRVTYLGHSGFLAETERFCLLFDWSEGELPPLPEKPLLVFSSHRHQDHFQPRIFTLDDGSRNVSFFLGHDLRLTDSRRQRWGVSPETYERCRVMAGNETITFSGVTVDTLPSTDVGVAFLVTCDGRTIYHAGDLNWWHWEGEPSPWNENMERDFKQYMEPLRDRSIHLAFAPLDPRQEHAADWGFRYLLELAEIRHIVPMHQWGDPSPTRQFCAKHPELAHRVLALEVPGETVAVNDPD